MECLFFYFIVMERLPFCFTCLDYPISEWGGQDAFFIEGLWFWLGIFKDKLMAKRPPFLQAVCHGFESTTAGHQKITSHCINHSAMQAHCLIFYSHWNNKEWYPDVWNILIGSFKIKRRKFMKHCLYKSNITFLFPIYILHRLHHNLMPSILNIVYNC